ncbi:hypothetical protein PSACC_01648 [Paramicrosporidium saccamoebae]|uniref:Uncharacterized protein n=1 Tax=Paramicrosporidium saccamoebae TaxID=1246581 RepID=A0A2H9TLA4_9FUNG|nr:hypothetical protein PSACC_01648 [Paramicrosporidium saccamoebae]
MTISEGGSFGRSAVMIRGLRDSKAAHENALVYPPDYARYLIGKTSGWLLTRRCHRFHAKEHSARFGKVGDGCGSMERVQSGQLRFLRLPPLQGVLLCPPHCPALPVAFPAHVLASSALHHDFSSLQQHTRRSLCFLFGAVQQVLARSPLLQSNVVRLRGHLHS